jgi:hypothetical protein
MWRRAAALIAAGVSAVALLAIAAPAALAAPTMVVNGKLMALGRDGPFRLQNTAGTGETVAMLAGAAAIIVVVGVVAWSLDRQSRRRLAAVPDRTTGDEWTGIGERPAPERQDSTQDQKRKAA